MRLQAVVLLLLVALSSAACRATSGLNLRRAASTASEVLVTIPNGASVDRIGTSSQSANGYTWYNLNYQGKVGWAVTNYLSGCDGGSSAPPPPSGGGGSCGFQLNDNPNFQAASTNQLAKADFQAVARDLGVEAAAVKAVADVEAGANGFLNNKPKILYEAAQFYRITNGRFGSCNTVSCSFWNRDLYQYGEAEYGRLLQAYAKDRNAAIQSASWGAFQIMGFNYKTCGYGSLEAFISDMKCGHAGHLKAFVGFIKGRGLTNALRSKDWAAFAYAYNGAGYKANAYDRKMANAYANAVAAGFNEESDEVLLGNPSAFAPLRSSAPVVILAAVAAALLAVVLVLAVKLRKVRRAAAVHEEPLL